MTCRLCQEKKQLLMSSHIIPDFMYGELYDENHFLETRVIDPDYVRKGKKPTGEYDKHILCKECDGGIIGQYETYAKEVLFGSRAQSAHTITNQHGITTKFYEVDYRRFKLFLLSILWRSGISTREFSSSVELGEHEEAIRSMLFLGDPGNEMKYPCFILSVRELPNSRWQLVGNPLRTTIESVDCHIFPIAGRFYVFPVTLGRLPISIRQLVVESTVRSCGRMGEIQIPTNEFEDMMFKMLLGQRLPR
jgi:hypothetical protein